MKWEEIREFLIEGRKNGYASGKKPKRNLLGAKIFEHHGDIFIYQDVYYDGPGGFSGIEVIVTKAITPVFLMVYDGGGTEEAYAFLKKALLARVEEARLIVDSSHIARARFEDERYRYFCKVIGDPDSSWQGDEYIEIKSWRKVYSGRFMARRLA